ncbi:MAG: hypothetical protein JXA72_06525 [Bacteroidales bacterium]|nr:hypothetical protein [Bacteroidales bacterium]
MKREIHNNYAFCKVLLLLVFIGYYSSLNLFYHAHIINGQVVYHSHPYKSNVSKQSNIPLPKHQHSQSEFYLIQQLDKSIWDDLVAKPDLPEIVSFPKIIVSSELPVKPITTAHTAICLRAPPSLVLFG